MCQFLLGIQLGEHLPSAVEGTGVTTADILKATDWSTESVFRRPDYRPAYDAYSGRAVLSSSFPSETSPGDTVS